MLETRNEHTLERQKPPRPQTSNPRRPPMLLLDCHALAIRIAHGCRMLCAPPSMSLHVLRKVVGRGGRYGGALSGAPGPHSHQEKEKRGQTAKEKRKEEMNSLKVNKKYCEQKSECEWTGEIHLPSSLFNGPHLQHSSGHYAYVAPSAPPVPRTTSGARTVS